MIRGHVKIVTELLSPWRRARGCGLAVGILDQLSRFRRRIRAGHSAGGPRHPRSPVTAPAAPPARALALRGGALMLVCTGLLVLPGQTLAQTAYVSNTDVRATGAGSTVSSSHWQAIQFTTGSQAGGYALGSIGMTFRDGKTNLTGLVVRIYTESGGLPGSVVHTLENPDLLAAGTEALFEPSSSVTLAADTDYFIAAESTGSFSAIWMRTTSGAENSGASAGWSIADHRHYRAGESGDWVESGDPIVISVYPPGQTLAQSQKLVSNLGETFDALENFIVGSDNVSHHSRSQAFTTGNGIATVTSVQIDLKNRGQAYNPRVSIYTDASGSPGTIVGTALTDPATKVDGLNTFTHSGINLAASTTYHVVVEPQTSASFGVRHTSSGNEDSDGTSGWTIAGRHRHRLDSASWLSQSNVLRIRVDGTWTPVSNNATGNPAITGTPQVGQTLTAGIGTIADADGLPTTFPGDYTFQWIRVDGGTETNIGSDQNTYTPGAADVGSTIKVQVDFTDDNGNDESRTSAAYPSSGSILAAKSPCPADATNGTGWCATMTVGMTDETSAGKRIRAYGFKSSINLGSLIERFFTHAGTNYEVARVRRVLTTDGGVVDSDFMTLWTDNAVPDGTLLKVDGRTAAFTIGPDSDDTEAVGAEKWDLETLGNPPNWIEGQKVTVSLNFPPTLSTTTATRTALVLTYDEDLDDSSVPAASAYAVTVDGSDRTVSSVAISGKRVTLTLVSAVTSGQTVIVSYTVPNTNPVQDATGIDAAALISHTVTSVNFFAIGAPTITGTPQVGQTLTAGIGTIADGNGRPTTFPNDYTFQWIRVDGGTETDIGSDQNTYRPRAADVGSTIKVKVSFTDDHGFDESRTSTAYPARGYPSSAIAIVAAKSACPTGSDWCETMAVGYATQGGDTYYGFDDRSSLGSPGTLTSTSIRDGTTTYTVRHIIIREPPINPATFQARFSAYLLRGTVLNVGGAEFALNAESEDSTPGSYTWSIPSGFSMVENQEMTVSLNFIAPTLSTATVDGTALVLIYDEDLDDSSVPAASAYSVKVDGSDRTVSSVAINGKRVTLTLASAVTSGQTVTVSYRVPDTNPVQNADGLNAAALIDEAVTNNTGNIAATGAPTILGVPQLGNTLTAGQGTIADGNGLPTTFPDDYTFQWVRVAADNTETDIGSDQNTYMPVAADVGSAIKVTVRFTDDDGFTEGPLASIPSQAVRAEPEDCDTDRPGADWCTTITVGVQGYTTIDAQGTRLTSTRYSFGPFGGGTIGDRTILPKHTVKELGIIDNVEGQDKVFLRKVEEKWLPSGTIFNFGGTEFDGDSGELRTSISVPGTYLWDRPANFTWIKGQKVTVSANISGATGAPEILGTRQVGKTLRAKLGTIADSDGVPDFPDDFTFQWVRVDGSTETDISGATSDTYTLTTAEEGKKVKVKVRFTDDGGSDEGPLKSGAVPSGRSTIVSASAQDPDGEVLLETQLRVVEYPSGTYTKWGCSGSTYCADGMDENTFKNTDDDGLERSFEITALDLIYTSTKRYILSIDFLTTRLSNYELVNLVLELDERKFRFDGADVSNCQSQRWHDVSERWSDGDVVQVRILDRNTGKKGDGCKPRASVRRAKGTEGMDDNLIFVVNLHPASNTQVTVDYQTSDGTATAGEDYESREGTLIFAPGETRKTILVPIINDLLEDPREEMYLTLKNASRGVEVYAYDGRFRSTATAVGTIYNTEDNPTPQLSVSDAEATEGEDTSLDFVVTMAPEASETVTVDYATSDGTATAGSDYIAASGKLTFAPGETKKTIAVTIEDDEVAEADGETVKLTLSNASGAGAVFDDSTAVGTIRDAPEVEESNQVEDSATPLTASFQQVPNSHDGTNVFTIRVAFSEELANGSGRKLRKALSVSGGTVDPPVLRVGEGRDLYNIKIKPAGDDDVTISVRATTDCTADDALCTSGGTALSNSLAVIVSGPPDDLPEVKNSKQVKNSNQAKDSATPLTASFQQVPNSHNGTNIFTIRVAFSEELANGSGRKLRKALSVSGGTVASPVLRVGESRDLYNIKIEPAGDDDVTISVRATTDCTADDALCTSGGTALSNSLAVTVSGPPDDPPEIEDSATPLTASFQQVPNSHDGTSKFTLRLKFSEAIASGTKPKLWKALSRSGADMNQVLRVNNRLDLFKITLKPKGTDDVTLSLGSSPTDCTADNAVCTSGGTALTGTATATVPYAASAKVAVGDAANAGGVGPLADEITAIAALAGQQRLSKDQRDTLDTVPSPATNAGVVDDVQFLAGVTPEQAAAALFGQQRLSKDQLAALDRLGNQNGGYDLGDLLSWINRYRQGQADSGTPANSSKLPSSGALLLVAAAGWRGQKRRSPVRGKRRGYALAALLTATVLWSCADKADGPLAPKPDPGLLTVELSKPADHSDIGILLELEGPSIESVRAPGLELYQAAAPQPQIVVAGPLRAGTLLQFEVPDRNRLPLYRVRILAVTGEDYKLRDVGAYQTAIKAN